MNEESQFILMLRNALERYINNCTCKLSKELELSKITSLLVRVQCENEVF